MKTSEIFQIYNASAGSGKTFTLVKEYLKIVLQEAEVFHFQKILAITFTNKAAGEMKERVLQNLHDFSEGKKTDLLDEIINETLMDANFIKEKGKKLLDAILHNYTAFSITTIDSFTHKIIKSFAYDLGLPLNFEVEMDSTSLLGESVDLLISRIGTNDDLTKLLIDFSLEKTDEDKSWDISRELNDFSKILLNEDDVPHFETLAKKQISDFSGLKNKLQKHQKKVLEKLHEIGEKGIKIIEDAGIKKNDFRFDYYPKHFRALIENVEKGLYFEGSKLRKRIDDDDLYAKTKLDSVKMAIDQIAPQLLALLDDSEPLYQDYLLNKLAMKSIIPLAVLNNINSELSNLKEENNIRLNSEFNQLISENIKDQPAPFIYERIGQRFMHYFIDEMQDTSVLQWQNLIPLIDNALAQEKHSLLLVGDGKQAIYRWRGGKATQFIHLENDSKKVFPFAPTMRNLDTNFRSFSEVINFNNDFFQHVSKFLQDETYKKMFVEGNMQQINKKEGGFVSLSFLEKTMDKDENALRFPKKIHEKIEELSEEFSLNEICILVRKKKDGIAVANYLSEQGVKVVSSDTLLINNSEKVQFIINLLQVIQHPNDKETFLEVLYFLYQHLEILGDKHDFIFEYINKDLEISLHQLENYRISFDLSEFHHLPFYEKIEEIIRCFGLIKTSDAYLQYFLDVILEQQRKGTSVQEFLDFWEQRKEKLSIVASGSSDAVQIMTIHKSKGLEFSVVIFPYDVDIYRQIDPKSWLSDLPEQFDDFDELLVSSIKDIQFVNQQGKAIFEQQQKESELDNFNLLYVALTRAVEQLHVITEKKMNAKGEVNTKHFSGIFIDYLQSKNLWKDDDLTYNFGDDSRKSTQKNEGMEYETQTDFVSHSWKEQDIKMVASASVLWDTQQGDAIRFGNLIHEIMSKIHIKDDVSEVIAQYIRLGLISKNDEEKIKEKVQKIVAHPDLVGYFSENMTIYNEREILGEHNEILIPDRLVINNEKKAIIIDYKTGHPSKSYQQQIIGYEKALKLMNFEVIKKILVYIGDEIMIEKV